MLKTWVTAIAAVALVSCRHPAGKPSVASLGPSARAGMDSAEIDRLCVSPDSVRAGRTACVLKDQSAPRPTRLQSNPP